MDLGVTFRLEHPPSRLVELMRHAESAGFTNGWVFDNPIAAMEPTVLLALCAEATSTIQLGACVTNPGTRHPAVIASALATLSLISHGRMVLGIGRGDSAVRSIGRPPASLADFEASTLAIRSLVEGGPAELEGTAIQLPWVEPTTLPVWIAGYGPRILDLASRIADGVILQVGDPTLLEILIPYIRERAAAAGRIPGAPRIQVAIPAHVGSVDEGIDHCLWYPMFLRHHLEVALRPWANVLPAGFIEAYLAADSRAAIRDEVRRTCLIGAPDAHIARIEALGKLGVDQVNLYLMDSGQAEIIDAYGCDIVSQVSARPNPIVAGGRP